MVFSLCKLCDPPRCAQVIIHVILTGERQGKRNRVIIIISQTEIWETMTCSGPKPVSYEWRRTIRCVVASCFLPNTQPCFSAQSYRWLLFFVYSFNSFVPYFFFLLWLSHVACGLHDQGSNPCPLHWKPGLLTTGPPGKSPAYFSGCFLELFTP